MIQWRTCEVFLKMYCIISLYKPQFVFEFYGVKRAKPLQ